MFLLSFVKSFVIIIRGIFWTESVFYENGFSGYKLLTISAINSIADVLQGFKIPLLVTAFP